MALFYLYGLCNKCCIFLVSLLNSLLLNKFILRSDMFNINKDTRNREAENKGAWMDYDEETSFLVARRTNTKYQAFISKAWRDNEKILTSKRNYDQSNKLADEFMLEAVAVHLLLDWKGVVDEKGKEVLYSPDLAVTVLEEHDDLRALIEEYAENRDNYIEEQTSKDTENLGKS